MSISLSEVRAGCQNAAHVWQEIAALGYHGSSASVYVSIRCLRKGVSLKDLPLSPPPRQLSSKQVRFLFLRQPTDLKPEERKDLEEILQRHADLDTLYQLVQQFRAVMQAHAPEQLDNWVQQVGKTSFPELLHFVSGLRKDWDTVRAACTVEWSNGMVEGYVNRFKLLKRQIYGRAKFDLLRLRVLHRDKAELAPFS